MEKFDADPNTDEDQGNATHFDVVDARRMLSNLNANIPILMCLRGDFPREPFIIKNARTSLGRMPQCDLQLQSTNVSRIHAFVKYLNHEAREEEPVVHFYDNQSTNGSYINGVQIHEERALRHGDLLGMGDFVFGYFVRKETELIVDQKAREMLTGQALNRGRVPTELGVRLRILIPEETFTPASVNGVAKDLSLTGLRFSTEEISEDFFRRLLSGSRYIRCELSLDALKKTHDLPGRMAWVHFDNKVKPACCVMGIEFKEMSSRDKDDLAMELHMLTEHSGLK